MSSTNAAESVIQEIGGDPLEGSGFEREMPEPDFSSESNSSKEEIL